MLSIPADHLRVLRNDIPVLTVIAELRMPCTTRGTRRTFRCPTAVNKRTNLARCFSCRRNFNPIDLVMAERRLTFLEAVRHLDALLPTSRSS